MRCATDLTDEEFALLASHLPTPRRLGRPRRVDLREVLNAILHLLRTGCPWDLLPKEFPPNSTVFGHFRRLREDGTGPTIHGVPVMAARALAGRETSPTAAIVDRQSVRTTEAGGPKGGACPRARQRLGPGDGGEGVDGRRRHVPVATPGALLVPVVATAGLRDRDRLAPACRRRDHCPWRPPGRRRGGGRARAGAAWRSFLPPAAIASAGTATPCSARARGTTAGLTSRGAPTRSGGAWAVSRPRRRGRPRGPRACGGGAVLGCAKR
jgi:transposase